MQTLQICLHFALNIYSQVFSRLCPETPNMSSFFFKISQICAILKESTDRDQNLISFDGGQDTSACKISDHYSHTFTRKCLETPDMISFNKSKWCQNEEN